MEKVNLNSDKKVLLKAFRKCKTKQDLIDFLDDLFTEEEILDLAQRLKIAKLIIEGKTYEEISPEVQTSTSTVSKIGQIIKFGKGSFSKIFANQFLKYQRISLPNRSLKKQRPSCKVEDNT